jgi:hypothetical protein
VERTFGSPSEQSLAHDFARPFWLLFRGVAPGDGGDVRIG